MIKYDMINYIKNFFADNQDVLHRIGIKERYCKITCEDRRLNKDIREGYKWFVNEFEPAVKNYITVYSLIPESMWQNYHAMDLMNDKTIYEIVEYNKAVKNVRKVFKSRPALFKKFKVEVTDLKGAKSHGKESDF